jgi:hypothetical protein
MDTSDNNINNHSVSSTNTGPMSRNTSVINIVHTSTPNKSPGTSGLPIAHSKSPLSQQQQQATHSKSTPASGQQPDQNNVNRNVVADEATKHSDGCSLKSTPANSTTS